MTYKMTYRNGKNIREHRAVMSALLGRDLSPDELVHHKDGNIRNNDINNLEIVTRREHMAAHPEVKIAQKLSTQKYYCDIDQLKQLYVDKELTAREVAEKLNLPTYTINSFIRKYGLKHKAKYCKACGSEVNTLNKTGICKRCYIRIYMRTYK